jgi:hypothetical protein
VTIFGFNTDIRQGDTVYHVQTEPHPNDFTIQTAIFVRGRCLDKRNVSYAEEAAGDGFSEDRIHELLTRQHKFVLTCIREGKLESMLHMETLAAALSGERSSHAADAVQSPADDSDVLGFDDPEPPPLTMVADPTPPAPEPPQLKLAWLASHCACQSDSVITRYRLTNGSAPVEGATLVARFEIAGAPAAYSRTITDSDGEGDFSFAPPRDLGEADQLTITVQASHSGRVVARRFRISRN